MTKQTEALQLALEALTYCEALNSDVERQKTQAIAAIKEALAEPVGCSRCNSPLFAGIKCSTCGRVTEPWVKTYTGGKPHYTEPVAWMHTSATGVSYFRKKPQDKVFNPTPVYTTPRPWIGLTDEETGTLTVFEGLHHVETPVLADFIRAIEAKLKEKNG